MSLAPWPARKVVQEHYVQGQLVEVLSCGHRVTRPYGPPVYKRRCQACARGLAVVKTLPEPCMVYG